MNKVYDALNPKPGVVVLPWPRDKIEGLTESQRRNMHRHDAGVLRPRQRCKPQALGMPSAIRVTQPASPIIETPRHGANSHTVRPGHRRRSPKPRTRSLCHRAGSRDFGKECERKRLERRRQRQQREVDRLVRSAKRCVRRCDEQRLERAMRRLRRLAPARLGEIAQYVRTCP